MNIHMICGNVGQDPDVKMTQSGTPVMKLRIATNERVKKNNEWTDHTEWHNVTVWGNRVNALAQYVHKGMQLTVVGKQRAEKYTDKNGQERFSNYILADDVQFQPGSAARPAAPVPQAGPPPGWQPPGPPQGYQQPQAWQPPPQPQPQAPQAWQPPVQAPQNGGPDYDPFKGYGGGGQ